MKHGCTAGPASPPAALPILAEAAPVGSVQLGDGIADAEFMICGSISSIRDMWKGLRDLGIPEETIYTEAFFSH